MIVDSIGLQKALCDLIGVDPATTRAIRIDVEAGSLPTIAVEQTILDGSELVEVFRGFEITELPHVRSEVRPS